MTTLSLIASKKVYEIVGEYDTELRWTKTGYAGNDFRLRRPHGGKCASRHKYPAPTLAELIRVLPKIGEKKGWEGERFSFVPPHHVLHIIAHYMNAPTEPEGMQAVEEYLLNLL